MKKSYNKAFTLVELLSVIVILAIILVIAVPKIMSVITDSKRASLETSAKMIASTAEKTKVQKELLGEEITGTVNCSEFTKVTSDYESCTVKFEGNTAKVNITGANKFEGLYICNANKNNATAQTNECINAVSFANDSWETIIAAVQSGEYPYKAGDTKEVELSNALGKHTLRIANTIPCSDAFPEGTSDKSETACGFVVEFADIITTHVMNSTATSVGGFPASSMFTYLNTEGTGIYNSLPIEIKNAIIGTKVISSHGSEDTENFTTEEVNLYLLSGEEIYSNWNASYGSDSAKGTSRQLDYYEIRGVVISNCFSSSSCAGAKKQYNGSTTHWWLRTSDGYDSDSFYRVGVDGDKFAIEANCNVGVSPAFRLAE